MMFFAVIFPAVALELSWINQKLLDWVTGEYGYAGLDRIEQWKGLLEQSDEAKELVKIIRVNDHINKLTYKSDMKIWGVTDYWATPIEAIGIGQADCEDYSIAKYFSLRELGVADEKLKVMYVKAIELNEAHMVLAYYQSPSAIPLILDNLNKKILPANERKDLVPVYSVNGGGLWIAKRRGGDQKVGAASKLSHWRDLRERMIDVMGKSI